MSDENEVKHSPTPWCRQRNRVYDTDGGTVASTGIFHANAQTDEANGSHIVKCVNTYDYLVRACNGAIASLRGTPDPWKTDAALCWLLDGLALAGEPQPVKNCELPSVRLTSDRRAIRDAEVAKRAEAATPEIEHPALAAIRYVVAECDDDPDMKWASYLGGWLNGYDATTDDNAPGTDAEGR